MRILRRALPLRYGSNQTNGLKGPSGPRPFPVETLAAVRMLAGITMSLLVLFGGPSSFAHASSVPELLVDIIASHNLALRQQSLEDETYRGEEGILRIGPEAGKKLGLKVSLAPEYLRAKTLIEDAEKHMKKAREAMATRSKEPRAGEYAAEIADEFLAYKDKTQEANELLRAYSAGLDPLTDERLDRQLCGDLLVQILQTSLKEAGHRLRDALGCFFNTCRGDRSKPCLTPENVRFVNTVFQEFLERSPGDVLEGFDLDRIDTARMSAALPGWKEAAGSRAAPIIPLVEGSLKKLNPGETVPMDPLLFLALIRQESQFDTKAISIVGAAGLTQIMPKTATDMGMENVYHPDYFDRAFSLLQDERKARKEALDALYAITPENREGKALEARGRMQASLGLRLERQRLFAKYRGELRKQPSDPRLHPEKAVEYGMRYFTGLLQDQKGDISLALASYNAGPHRVLQYKGIPPFGETVRFRNRVLEFYREYLDRLPGS
ncbi:MAG: transglycosylase SLT domain-containing protein [Desulfatiglandales bacterium]